MLAQLLEELDKGELEDELEDNELEEELLDELELEEDELTALPHTAPVTVGVSIGPLPLT